MLSTALPFANRLPTFTYGGRRYCFTFTFTHGTRDACKAIAAKRGATAGSLTKNMDILVVGQYATASWLHSPCGLKIIEAKAMQDAGQGVPRRDRPRTTLGGRPLT